MPLTGCAPPFFVRASAIQSGDGIKNQKVSLSKRHPGWCTLMSPWKFEIHMLSHFILFPLSLSLPYSHTISPSVFPFSSPSSSSSPSRAIMYYSVRKRETKGNGEECKMYLTRVSESPFPSFIFHVFTLRRRREDIMNHLIFF